MDVFLVSVEEILRHEGGFVDDPRDPGGATKWGISLRFAKLVGDLDGDGRPDLDVDGDGDIDRDDIFALPKEQAIDVFRRQFWLPARCDRMPAALALAVFDSAVNQGRGPAISMLQGAAGVAQDGRPGPKTLAALWKAKPRPLLAAYCTRRALRYAGTKNFDAFGKGWLRRLFAIHEAALDLAVER